MSNRLEADGKPKYRVGEATRERILEVAERLAVLLMEEPGKDLELARQKERELYRQGYTVLFGYTWGDPERFSRLVETASAHEVRKLYATLPRVERTASLEKLRESGILYDLLDDDK